MANVKFKVSSALKTILGKELITDDFIAVFELVKNSFDAQARHVGILFDNAEDGQRRIVISDDGVGMDKADIDNKWLFVAYSAKKSQKDYRDKIKSTRIFAGAKGIGRFSCDRLGERLRLFTRKKGAGGKWHVLSIDWGRFEVDPEQEFHQIPAQYEEQQAIPFDAKYGTVLEITGLRDDGWNRKKLIDLRRSLERLVNPNQDNDSSNFRISLSAPDEAEADKEALRKAADGGLDARNVVNGPVQNFLFEDLGLRTAQIEVKASSDGTTVSTRLEDRGTLIYELLERNPYQSSLADVKVSLFHLNRSAKATFTSRMGVQAREYGSVFLYKNGFRIHPFGSPDDDSLGILHRHQQGVFRSLGTRDLSGRIELNGLQSDFQETSSRDGGLIRNQAFHDLKALTELALKRLEKYVLDLMQFGPAPGEMPDPQTLSEADAKRALFDIVINLTQSKEVLEVKYDPDLLNILENKSSESVSALLGNLKRIAAENNNTAMSREVAKAERQLKRLAKAKDDAEAAEAAERKKAKDAEAKARHLQEKVEIAEEAARRSVQVAQDAQHRERHLNTQNLFLKSVLSTDVKHIVALHHTVSQDALTIEQYVSQVLGMLKDDSTPNGETLRVPLERISYVAKKIRAVSRFATKANFLADSEQMDGDLVEFIREYLLNVYGGVVFDTRRRPIPIQFHQPPKAKFPTEFRPINVGIVFDNFLSNSRKHKATRIDVSVVDCAKDALRISFADDGSGIPKKNGPSLFQIGFSTTDGSGLGLHHVREIMTEMGGAVEVNLDRTAGAEFLLTFKRT